MVAVDAMLTRHHHPGATHHDAPLRELEPPHPLHSGAGSPRWDDPAALIFAALAFAIVFGARHLVDGLHATPRQSLVTAGIMAGCCYVAAVIVYAWFDAASQGGTHRGGLVGMRTARIANAHRPTEHGGATTMAFAAGIRRLIGPGERMAFPSSLRQRFAVYWLALVACWAPWYAFCWPGVMRDDTIAQFMQSSGYHAFYTQHPLFDTLVFGLFWHAGRSLGNLAWGLALYTGVQAIAMAANTSLALCYLRTWGVPRLALVLGLLYAAFDYGMVGSVTTMSKDSLNTVFLIPLSLIVIEACLTRGRAFADNRLCAAFVVLLFLTVISKRTMLIVMICSGIMLLLAAGRMRIKAFLCMLAAVLLAECVWTPCSTALTHAHVTLDRDVFGLVMLPIARIQSDEPQVLTVQERARLAPFMNVVLSGRQYDDERSDETSWTIRPGDALPLKITALKAWVEVGVHHPLAYIRTYATLDARWYYPNGGIMFPWGSGYLFDTGYMKRWETFVTPPVTARAALHDLSAATGRTSRSKVRVAARIRHYAHSPVASYSIYVTYIPLMVALYLATRRRWPALAAWSVLGFTSLSLFASPSALCWFMTPIFSMLPLFTGLGFIPSDDIRDARAQSDEKPGK
ncbi:MAG: DUF6020 family protein [Bifidobacterium sp.]|jgi:hypothetical protein|nr:DUF6020 family protein [Bifidobacterium sp.]